MKQNAELKRNLHRLFEIAAVGALTGAFVGVVITLYNALVEICEEFSRGYYGYILERPAFLPLLFLGLFLGAIVVGGLVRFLPILRGSGFPQTEGAAQGLLKFKWYKVLTGMFVASLIVIFFGLSAGSEGPSLMMGGAVGDGIGSLLKRNSTVRRYQITGGACAGLAVALNAPLTGIVFAYEETHKRFTPEVFASSFTAVVVAMVIRSLLAPALGLFAQPIFRNFYFAETSIAFLPYVLLAAAIVSLLGIGFYYAALWVRKLFRKIRPRRGMWGARMLIPFLCAGAAGLITVNVMGGGVHFIGSLASRTGSFESLTPLFSAPVWATLLVAVVLRILVTALNIGAETPCCTSFPFFAIGAGTGALLSLLFMKMGMPAEFTDTVVIICLSTFFATVIKAPFTGIIMTIELTGSFTYLLPVVMAVAISILLGRLFRTEPLYEKLLEDFLEEQGESETFTVRVRVSNAGAGNAIRDILWPATAFVTAIERGGQAVPVSGGAVLEEGDVIAIEGAPQDRGEYLSLLRDAVGEIVSDAETANAPPMSENNLSK